MSMASLVAQLVKSLPAMQGTQIQSLGQENPLEKGMAIHSSTLAWRIPWTEKPGRLQSVELQESDTTERLHFLFSLSCIGEGNGNPLQCSCLENPRDRGAWWTAIYGAAQSQTRLNWLSSMYYSSLFVLDVCVSISALQIGSSVSFCCLLLLLSHSSHIRLCATP